MKAFEIINEVEVPTGILDKYGNPITKTVTPTSTVSTPKTTSKVKIAYDPNIPTRDQLSRSQVRKMARTGKVNINGQTFTKNAIMNNTRLAKAQAIKLTKTGSANVAKGAQADLKQLMKKNKGIFAKGAPQATPTAFPAKGIIAKLKNKGGILVALAAQGYITYEQVAQDISDYGEYYQMNGCTVAKGPYSDKLREQRASVNNQIMLGVVEFLGAIAGGAAAVGLLSRVFAAVPGFGWIAFVVSGLSAMAVGQLARSLSQNTKLLSKVAEYATGWIFTDAMLQDMSGGNLACATESVNEEQKPMSKKQAKVEIHSIVKQDKDLMKLIAMAKKAKKSN